MAKIIVENMPKKSMIQLKEWMVHKIYTHIELVEHAARFLRRQHVLVLTEMVGGCGEEADAIGWNSSGMATLIECKATRNDFLADKTKWFRRSSRDGMAAFRYYLINEGVIDIKDLPENWGLITIKKHRFRTVLKAEFQLYDTNSEIRKILSAIRRIGQTEPEGISVKAYTYQTKCNATLGISWNEETAIT